MCGEGYSGTTVRIQVQDGVGGCGMASWSQLALSKALEVTLEGHRAERTEGRVWVSPRPTLTIPMCPLPHHPECPPLPHLQEPDCQQGSGHWWGAGAGSCPHREPPQRRSGATWLLADGFEGVVDAFDGGSRPLLGRGQYRLREASLDTKSHLQTHSHYKRNSFDFLIPALSNLTFPPVLLKEILLLSLPTLSFGTFPRSFFSSTTVSNSSLFPAPLDNFSSHSYSDFGS